MIERERVYVSVYVRNSTTRPSGSNWGAGNHEKHVEKKILSNVNFSMNIRIHKIEMQDLLNKIEIHDLC